MVIAYFCTFTCYGFWLPNDPRGSGSSYVGSKNLLPFGLATKVHTRHSVAKKWSDPIIRREAKSAMKHPSVILSGPQARAVGSGFAKVLAKAQCAAYACAILPDHVHLVVSRPPYPIEQLVNFLKGGATTALLEAGLHPFQTRERTASLPKMWGRGGWNVFLNNDTDILNRINYVRQNPAKQGLPAQHWNLVEDFVGAQ